MGKATVVSELGGGRYMVRLVYERAQVDRRIQELQARIAQIDGMLPGVEADLNKWLAEQDARSQDLMAKIQAGATPGEIQQAEDLLAAAERKVIELSSRKAELELERAACERKVATLQANLPPQNPDPVEALCIDGTEGLTGDVGTIEVDLTDEDQADQGPVLIRPGYGGGAVWSGARDGILKPPAACLPEEVFYNYAVLPGLARWRPRYRLGTVHSVDHGTRTLTVDVDDLRLTHQDLQCRHAGRVTATAEYRGNTSVEVFEPGDRVVLEARPPQNAQTWADGPWVVVGFAENPKMMETEYILEDGAYLYLPGDPPWKMEIWAGPTNEWVDYFTGPPEALFWSGYQYFAAVGGPALYNRDYGINVPNFIVDGARLRVEWKANPKHGPPRYGLVYMRATSADGVVTHFTPKYPHFRGVLPLLKEQSATPFAPYGDMVGHAGDPLYWHAIDVDANGIAVVYREHTNRTLPDGQPGWAIFECDVSYF